MYVNCIPRSRQSDDPRRWKKQRGIAVPTKSNSPPDARKRGVELKKHARGRPSESDSRKRNSLPCDRHTHAQEHGKRLRRIDARDDNFGHGERMYVIAGLSTIARTFVAAWFPRELTAMLQEAIREVSPTGNRETLRLVESFRKAFPHTSHGIKGPGWNPGLTAAMSQIRQIRCTHAGEYSQLSHDATTTVLWKFAVGFLLAPHQLKLPVGKLRNIAECILRKHIGCPYRLRAVVKIGLGTFGSAVTKADMVVAFIDYLGEIEKTAACFKEAHQRPSASQ